MRGTTCLAAAAGLLVIGVTAGMAAAQSPPAGAPGELRALSVRYADGRTTSRVLSTKGRASWTVTFPRVPGVETTRDGLRLSALQFEEAPDPPNVVVTLALLYGSPHQKRLQVASVRLTDERPVSVTELEAYGVKPVTLALVSVPVPQLHIPSVTSPSSELAFDTYVRSEEEPGYRVVITNQSTRDVMGLRFEAFRGRTKSVSGMPRGSGHTPLIPAGGTYELRLGASTSGNRGGSPQAPAWLPLDRIEITSVLWSDGLVEGDPQAAARERMLGEGTARQLARIVTLLRTAAADPASQPLGALRAAITELPVAVDEAAAADARAALARPEVLEAPSVRSTMQSGMQNAKNAVLNDLEQFARRGQTAGPSDYADWLRATVVKFDAWRQRIISAPR
jgi:hypothetical protein